MIRVRYFSYSGMIDNLCGLFVLKSYHFSYCLFAAMLFRCHKERVKMSLQQSAEADNFCVITG